MRVLFSHQPLSGYFHPLVPLGRAMEAAGHEVAFACTPSFCPTVAAAGLRCMPVGLDWDSAEAQQAFAPFWGIPAGEAQTLWAWDHIFCGLPAE
jgi:UDP:flavonoid glycosyltransferase YjiC (YdhE family)